MRTIVLPLIALAVALAAPLQAQILKVHFTDEKAARKFRKHTSEIGGEPVFIGEPVPGGGVLVEFKGGRLTNLSHKSNARNEFFVLDPDDPTEVPYRMEDGVPVARGRRSTVDIHGKYIDRLSVMVPNETIETLAREYRLRRARLEELRERRDEQDRGSAAWFEVHTRLLGAYERLISWLEAMSFHELAEDLRDDYEDEAEDASERATQVRAQRALESVEVLGTPDELAEAAREVAGDRFHFKVAESQHLRLTYVTERISDRQAEELLEFGERVVEGFRAQFVDPYVSETFEDRIPDGLFQEFYFGPEDRGFHEAFVPAYYGLSWGSPENRARRLESTGNRFLRASEPRLLDAWRLPESEDLEGVFAHNIGHALADYHFNGGPAGMEQDWIEEGLGYYLSFEFLGRNAVTCREFQETHYVGDEGNEGYKEVQMGYRDVLYGVALGRGERIDQVIIKELYEMEDPDLAKSWAFLEYLARSDDLAAQRWMRAACQLARSGGTFIQELRAASEELFGIEGQDVFKVLDDRWRAYAKAEAAKASLR